MKVSRRDFLKLAGLSTFGAVACNIFPDREFQQQSPLRLPEDLVTGVDNWYATTARSGAETEGLVIRVMEGRAKKVEGNPLFPINQGAHSMRTEALLQELYHPDRIPSPMRRIGPRGSGQWEPISWDDALNTLRDRLGGLSDRNRMLMITNSLRGSLANVVQQFVQAYGGRAAALDHLHDAAASQAAQDLFGQAQMPVFDIRNSEYILSFGADFLATWGSPIQYSKGYGHFRQGEGRSRGTLIHVDPRFSLTAANADQWVPIKPGQEGRLALSIAHVIISEGLGNPAAVSAMTGGNANILEAYAPERISHEMNIPLIHGVSPVDMIREIARDLASHGPRSLVIGGGSASAHTNGYFNLAAIYALNFLVGSVGQQGGILLNPPAPTPELGAAITPTPARDWQAIRNDIAGGVIQLVMVRGADPVHGLAGDLDFAGAINRDDVFVVSFATVPNDTSSMADLILPERAALEDWGSDVPNPAPGFQVVGIQQPVVNPLPEYNPMGFGDVLLRMANELGIANQAPLNRVTFADVLKDHARGLQALNRGSVRDANFDVFWNRLLQQGGWWDEGARGAAAPAAPSLADIVGMATDAVISGPEGGNTFNLLAFPHISLTDGRGASLPWLQSTPDPVTTVAWTTWVEMNTDTADLLDLKEGDHVTIEGANGRSFTARVYHHPAAPKDMVSVPMGQGHRNAGQYAAGRGVNVLEILGLPVEERTGSLAWSSTRIRLTPAGRNEPIPKFEGIVPAFQLSEHEAIVKVTQG
jgi:anaerobic selenocysteine-containing dehydrogenase